MTLLNTQIKLPSDKEWEVDSRNTKSHVFEQLHADQGSISPRLCLCASEPRRSPAERNISLVKLHRSTMELRSLGLQNKSTLKS